MKKRLLAMLFAAVLVFALVACGGTTEEPPVADVAEQGGEMPASQAGSGDAGAGASAGVSNESNIQGAIGIGETGESVDPADHEYVEINIGSVGAKFVGHFDATSGFSTDVGQSALNLVFDRVFFVDPSTRQYTSTILDSWEVDENNVVILHVKEGVVFNRSGNQLLASDILYSFRRNTNAPMAAGNWAKYVDLEAAYVSEDNMTAYIPFNMEFGAYQSILSIGVLEETWIEAHGGDESFDWFDPSLANGTGAYIPTEMTIDISASYELVDDWWGTEDYMTTTFCYANKINCFQYTDETTMMIDFENEVIDLALSLGSSSMERVIDDPSIGTAQSVSSNAVSLLVMNYDIEDGNPLFDNENLRKAICYGADWEALAELGYGVLHQKPVSSIASTSQYCVPGYTYEYDPELARQYRDESGLDAVELRWLVQSGSSAAVIAEAFNAYMAALDITVNVEVYDVLTCIAQWQQPNATDFQIINDNNANTSGDPFTNMTFLGSTASFKCSNRNGEEINALIDNAAYSFDPAVRADYYAQLQAYLYDSYSVIPLSEWNLGLAYGEKIKSTRITDVYTVDLRYIGF